MNPKVDYIYRRDLQSDLQNLFRFSIFFILLCLTFTDFRLALVMFFDSSFLGILGEQAIVTFLLLIQAYILLTRKHSLYVYLFLIVIFWQISIYFFKGYGLRYVYQAFANDGMFLLFLAWFQKGEWTRKGVMKVLLAFVCLHLIFVLLEYFGISAKLVDKFTGYGDTNTDMGYRFTGLFIAPGVLSLFSAFMAIYGATDYKLHRDYLGLSLFFLATILGLLSGNRSFILATIIGLLAVYRWRPRFPEYRKTSKLYSLTLISAAILLLVSPVFIFLDEIRFILDRFQWDTLMTDIYTRTQGRAGSIPALKSLLSADSILGTTSLHPVRGFNAVLFEGEYFSLNNSYSSMLVSLG